MLGAADDTLDVTAREAGPKLINPTFSSIYRRFTNRDELGIMVVLTSGLTAWVGHAQKFPHLSMAFLVTTSRMTVVLRQRSLSSGTTHPCSL